tara:strand:+ start:1618 stop:2223 length:606 start_codon:yes stop_codon:yes gene_type:complete
MKIIKQGAEAILYLEENILIKERIKKEYRIKEIDDRLRKFRTRREVKILEKTKINVPKVYSFSDKDMKIKMEYIKGDLLRDIFDDLKEKKKICFLIGENIARLHNEDIIHGDLATSNMILKKDKLYFIDFGLGFFSKKIEDKAVDLYLLKQLLKSKHYKNYEEDFSFILQGYEKYKDYKEVLERLNKVENRGRYKGKKKGK